MLDSRISGSNRLQSLLHHRGQGGTTDGGFNPPDSGDLASAGLPQATGQMDASGLGATIPQGAAVTTSAVGTTVSGVVASIAPPSWISGLATASIKSDMTAADLNGTVTYSGLETLFADLDSKLTSAGGTLTSAELSDLDTIAADLNTGITTSSYLVDITAALVNGNAANATWTGGTSKQAALGNLAVGTSATQLNELIGKWFLGTDLPDSKVVMSGSPTFTVTYSTVSSALFGASGPSVTDVNQGNLGDCFFMGSLGEVVCQNPSAIQSMFTSNGNGTYGVRFYENGVATYVTVNSALADGGTMFNGGTDIWASLAEKAYTQLQATANVTGNTVNDANAWSTIGNGGDTMYALEEITDATQVSDYYANGSTWSSFVLNSNLKQTSSASGMTTSALLSLLVSDLTKGDDLLVDSSTDATDSSGKQTLVSDHAMIIYGFDTTTNMLEIRNPWGTGAGQTWDTTFEVSLTTLLSDNDDIVVDNIGVRSVILSNAGIHQNSVAGMVHAINFAYCGTVQAQYAKYNYIDGLDYIASFSDLIKAYGANATAGQAHFLNFGIAENRITAFDGLDYVASYQDLIKAFAADGSETAIQDAGATHYISFGSSEGRTSTFNGLDYIASYGDLIKVFGTNSDAGAVHYIEFGSEEGRTVTFDGLDYIASYSNLITSLGANEQAGAAQYVTSGYAAGQTTTFNGLDYIASYSDLIKALGANNDVGAAHYITHGSQEGRTVTFDGLAYIANYTSLMTSLGANEQAGATNYINTGFAAGKSATFNVSGYLTAHTDLQGLYTTNDQFLTAYITTYATTGHYLT